MAEYSMKNLQRSNEANQQAEVVIDNLKTANKKSQCSIYKDFINRVQPLNNDKPDASSFSNDVFTKPSLLEPLNNEELQSLINSIEDSGTDIGESLSNSEPEPEPEPEPDNIVPVIDKVKTKNETKNKADPSYTNHHDGQPLKPLLHQKIQVSTKKTASNISWLVTGMICGLLLSVATMVILNKSGFIPTLTESFQDGTATRENRAEGQKDTAMGRENQANAQNNPKLPVEKVAPPSLTPETSQQSTAVAQQQIITPNSNISIDDFYEESQSTLYRDIKD